MPDERDSEMEDYLRAHGPFEQPPLCSCGERVGDWKVLAFLGRGGTSEVYRAENVITGLVAALKVLVCSDDRARIRFKREVQLVADMRSSAFPKFYGAGESGGLLYLAEELLEPVSLPSQDSAVAQFIMGVCVGVDELHRQGFVHRDIKPGNVMMRPSTGESVLIDMGLAKGCVDSPQTSTETLSVVDGHAVGVGTPGFSAPEQFVGGRISAATDIHAIGMLANACFGGKPPRVWTTIIRRSTSSIPEQRYATVEEFARAVRHRWRGRRLAVACAVFGSAMLGVFAWATSVNGGDFWLRQAWLSGRQVRSIKQSLGDSPKTEEVVPKQVIKKVIEERRPEAPTFAVTNRSISQQAVVKEKQPEAPPPEAVNASDKVKSLPIDREKQQQSNGDRPRKVHQSDGDRPQQTQHNTNALQKISESDRDRPQQPQQPDGDRPQKVDEDKLLGMVWDVFNDPLLNQGTETVKPKPQEVMSEGAAGLLGLGKMVNENGKVFMRIALDGRDVQIQGDIHLERPRRIVIDGPGRIKASISGVKDVKIELGKRAALINLTDKPYPQSGIRYILHGACYLNFKNLDRPKSGSNRNIWVDDLSGKGRPLIRFRGRPDTYDEAVEEQKKIAIELMKKGQLDWI